MRRFTFAICLFLGISMSMQSQSRDYPMGISFKKLMMDYQSQNGGDLGAIKDYHHGVEIGFHKRIAGPLNVVIPFKYGNINDGQIAKGTRKSIIGADLQFQCMFYNKTSKIIPYLMGGIGGVKEIGGDFNAQVPFGAGLNFRAADNAWVNIQSEYRYSFAEDRNNLHHAIGFVYLFGKKSEAVEEEKEKETEKPDDMDSDGDGILNKLDLCPDVAGPSALNGCPDTDGDGIADFKDKCPGQAGIKSLEGCPDSDGDGISDNEDECPNLIGTSANKGCPEKEKISDRDGDGVMDKDDNCPDVVGLMSNKGCPEVKKVMDSDGDGVPDKDDDCPNVAGLMSNHGCPEVKKVFDRDGDGVEDKDDNCPDVVGFVSNNGCPEVKKTMDRDGDGIEDNKDNCPDVPGRGNANGCPESDRDGDGMIDKADRCPDTKGLLELNGCPDSDGDGIADPDDKCPKSAGPKVYGGCPDSDGDGLDDSIDKCPNSQGTVANNGCPEIAVEDKKTLDIAMRAVQFDSGLTSFKGESFTILKQIAGILNRYPDYNLAISGHTDNSGSAVANQELSEKRAKACHDYLITLGISSSRLSWAGYGESRPIADNDSLNGRSLNRRVEFSMVPR